MNAIIAEIGVNHNGSVAQARDLIVAAHRAGATAAKFQTFSADRLAGAGTPKVPYQTRSGPPGESHRQMLRKLELDADAHRELRDFCAEVGIAFCSTPYSREDAEFLHALGVPFFKTSSADLVDRRLHEFIAGTGRGVLVAVGMATLGEIEATLELYDRAGTRDRVTLLHCVSAYPAPVAELNLRILRTLADAFGVPVGFSDHSEGPWAAVAAVALGARVIEKHFTLDRHLEGPDHLASSTPEEFSELVRAIAHAEAALGSGIKRVQESEQVMRRVSRKSIVAARPLGPGQVITLDSLQFRRPGTGLSPMVYTELLGRRTRRAIEAGEPIGWDDLDHG